MSSSSEDAVYEVYRAWCEAFQNVDGAAMKALFDQDHPGLIYQSEENVDPLYTWAEIDEYWGAVSDIVASIPQWDEITRKIDVDGDSAAVYAKLMTHLVVVGAKRPLIGELRSTIGLHKIDGAWKIINYHESRHLDLAFLFED